MDMAKKVPMNLLTELIHQEYKERNIKLTIKHSPVYQISPLVKLTNEQERILNNGDGQVPDQYKQINSSTGLAVNYYKILENLGLINDLIFENKIAKPLNKGGRCANIDVSYKRDGVLYFVESKFLEPYYSGNEKINKAYLDVSRYPIEVEENHHEEWHKLFQESKEFKDYNFSQLCRHLLALYRYTHGIKGSAYKKGEDVVLQSVTWEMPNKFMEKLEESNRKNMEGKNDNLNKEAEKCQNVINSFIKSIEWTNMRFQALHYNNMLDDIKESKHYREFCKRYFF